MIVNGQRALAYIQKVAWVRPIEGADNIELIGVLGWTCIAKKGEFREGDFCVYFEIDSKLPETEWSEFMRAKNFKVKTMKLGKFNVVSQGLALPIKAFPGWDIMESSANPGKVFIAACVNGDQMYFEENSDVTEALGVTYSVVEDNKRKAPSVDKYKKMAQRNPKIFKQSWAKWLMRRAWGRKLMFAIFGKKKDKRTVWPEWVVKTDEERVQNMPWILENKEPWIATEKIDGTSTTFTMKGRGRKREFYICSRNVVFDKPDQPCFYDSNVYLEMAKKYDIEKVMAKMMEDDETLDFITIQGETYGAGIQKRTYGLEGHDFMAFNVILSSNGCTWRLNPELMTIFLDMYKIPCVPIVDTHFIMPNTVQELLDIATDESVIDGGMREGLVFRSYDGKQSFKAVSNEFLMKYHG